MKKTRKNLVDINNTVGRKKYRGVIQQIINDGVCPFCPQHFLKYHTEKILRRGKHWLVTFNMNPYVGSRLHFIFVLHKHVEKLEKLKPAEWEELLRHFQWVVKKYRLQGGTAFMRFGDTDFTGASVSHLHAQLIIGASRKKNSDHLTAVVGFKK